MFDVEEDGSWGIVVESMRALYISMLIFKQLRLGSICTRLHITQEVALQR